MGPKAESASVTFQSEGNEVLLSVRLNVLVFIRLSFVTVTETLVAVPGTRYSCCEDNVTSISVLATTGIDANGRRTALNNNSAIDRLDFLRMTPPQHFRHSLTL